MPGLTREHLRIINYLEPQGVTVTRTTKGLLFRLPNGSTESLHFTQSDWRATRNFRAQLRRNGVEYPGDYSQAKSRKKPYKQSVEKITTALESWPEGERVTTVELCRRTGNMTSSTVVHVMQSLGWWHDYKKPGSRQTYYWNPPIDPHEIVEELPEPEPVEDPINRPALREFLDTVDSWCVQLDGLDQTTTVAQLRALYAASGLNAELRVWRAESA